MTSVLIRGANTQIQTQGERTHEDLARECVGRSVMSDSLQTHGLQPTRLLCPFDFPGKNTRVGCPCLLQGIFQIQGLNPGLLHCRQILFHLSHQESPGREGSNAKECQGLLCASRSWKMQGRILPQSLHREHGPMGTLISDI